MPISIFRTFLLVLAVLAALSAVLDGILVRCVWQPLIRHLESQSTAIQYPPGMRYMLSHAWARRAYNLTFAAVTLVVWWYLGTPAGARLGH